MGSLASARPPARVRSASSSGARKRLSIEVPYVAIDNSDHHNFCSLTDGYETNRPGCATSTASSCALPPVRKFSASSSSARASMSFTTIENAPQRLNRSELAVPGSQPHFFEKAAKGAADIVFLDLEDAVAPDEKEKARKTIIAGLNDVDW